MSRKSILIAAALLLSASTLRLEAQTYSGRIGAGSAPTPDKAGGTVVVALALSDGLVLAADSRLTLTFTDIKPEYKIASDSASKLFSVGNVAITFYGEAFILDRTISSFVSEFDASLKESKPSGVDETAKLFSTFFRKYYDQHVREKKKSPTLGFILAGYNNNAGYGKLIELVFPGKPEPSELPNNTRQAQGAVWRGQSDVIVRLIKGYDVAIGGLPTFTGMEEAKQKALGVELSKLEYTIPFAYFTLQDGIDFALMLVQTTVDMQRFSFGTISSVGAIPGVGGAVDVIAITPSGLTWVKRKALSVR